MTLYRLRLVPRGAYATLFLADTLYGHLCWAAIRTGAGLGDLLEAARSGAPKFVLSDGFPGDLLPMPVLPPSQIPQDDVSIQRVHFQQEKHRKETRWLTRADFSRILQGKLIVSAELMEEDKKAQPKHGATLKNTINRLTGTTPADPGEGGLYEMEETFQTQVTVYAQVEDGYRDTLEELLGYLSQTGYGKRKSIGYGAFREPIHLGDPLADDFFGSPANPNGFVSLSTFVPAQNDPTEGWWQLLVKYGKLGEELAASENPFKRPLLMLRAGAVFKDAPVRPFYGRVVEDIGYGRSASQPDGLEGIPPAVQVCLALPVGMRLPEDMP